MHFKGNGVTPCGLNVRCTELCASEGVIKHFDAFFNTPITFKQRNIGFPGGQFNLMFIKEKIDQFCRHDNHATLKTFKCCFHSYLIWNALRIIIVQYLSTRIAQINILSPWSLYFLFYLIFFFNILGNFATPLERVWHLNLVHTIFKPPL